MEQNIESSKRTLKFARIAQIALANFGNVYTQRLFTLGPMFFAGMLFVFGITYGAQIGIYIKIIPFAIFALLFCTLFFSVYFPLKNHIFIREIYLGKDQSINNYRHSALSMFFSWKLFLLYIFMRYYLVTFALALGFIILIVRSQTILISNGLISQVVTNEWFVLVALAFVFSAVIWYCNRTVYKLKFVFFAFVDSQLNKQQLSYGEIVKQAVDTISKKPKKKFYEDYEGLLKTKLGKYPNLSTENPQELKSPLSENQFMKAMGSSLLLPSQPGMDFVQERGRQRQMFAKLAALYVLYREYGLL